MAKAHHSRSGRASRTPIDPSESPERLRSNPTDLHEILGHFSDALAFVETAYAALEDVDSDERPIGSQVVTLKHGLDELTRVYEELDLAIVGMREGKS